MNTKIRILDKSRKCNKHCGSCAYWKPYGSSSNGIIKHHCSNTQSDEYMTDKRYWNCCKKFIWATNIIDKKERRLLSNGA